MYLSNHKKESVKCSSSWSWWARIHSLSMPMFNKFYTLTILYSRLPSFPSNAMLDKNWERGWWSSKKKLQVSIMLVSTLYYLQDPIDKLYTIIYKNGMNHKSTMHGYVNPRPIFIEHQEIGPTNMISWTRHSNNDNMQ